MSFLGKLASAPIKVAASAVRSGGIVVDVMCGDPSPEPDKNLLDKLADTVERDVDGIVGEE